MTASGRNSRRSNTRSRSPAMRYNGAGYGVVAVAGRSTCRKLGARNPSRCCSAFVQGRKRSLLRDSHSSGQHESGGRQQRTDARAADDVGRRHVRPAASSVPAARAAIGATSSTLAVGRPGRGADSNRSEPGRPYRVSASARRAGCGCG
jgi:hypothetical protein